MVSFTLVNADSDTDIREIMDGDTVDMRMLSSSNINVRANTDPAVVGSVKFWLGGTSQTRTDNTAPYSLYGDSNGDYNGFSPPTNIKISIAARAYSESNASGAASSIVTLQFYITGVPQGSEGMVPDTVELNALNDLFNSTYGIEWDDNTNWLSGTTHTNFATWHGIEVTDGDITKIDLKGNNLLGTLPESLGDLFRLKHLHLQDNYIYGETPETFANLNILESLYLYDNVLTAIPGLEQINNRENFELKVEHNRLDFVDLEPYFSDSMVHVLGSFYYYNTPQF